MAIANYRYKLHIINIPHNYIMCYKFELIMFEILLNLSQNNNYYSYLYVSTLFLRLMGYKLTNPFNYGATAYFYHSYVCVLSHNFFSTFTMRM